MPGVPHRQGVSRQRVDCALQIVVPETRRMGSAQATGVAGGSSERRHRLCVSFPKAIINRKIGNGDDKTAVGWCC
ncbi:hypothetical protein DPEC_G00011610 [Dallia pectoralis]|uniref:Uncharacterized protein n=1 Tax=Dallia pectoralis TaxID=75939 RepID=A0ACC2HLS5_DALPE|nr:hypothetical protein DPEC_G00011610 [Dallia pectoralis]